MDVDKNKNYAMKKMEDVMDEEVPEEQTPNNILHCF